MEVLGMISGSNQTVAVSCDGDNTASVQLSGSVGTGEVIFEASLNDTDWHEIRAVNIAGGSGAAGPFPVTKTTAAGIFRLNVAGVKTFRCRGGSWPLPATVNVSIRTKNSVNVDGTSVIVTGDIPEGSGGGSVSKPVYVGGLSANFGFSPNPGNSSVRWPMLVSRIGQVFTIGGHPNVTCKEFIAETAQSDTAIITPNANQKIVITSIEASLDADANVSVGLRVGFGEDSVPTQPADGESVSGMALSHAGLTNGSCYVRGNGTGIVAVGAASQSLRVSCSDPTGGQLRILVTYFVM